MVRAVPQIPAQSTPFRWRSLNGWLNGLQLVAVIVAVVAGARGVGHQLGWVILALVIPALRYAFAPTFRRQAQSRFAHWWAQLEAGGDTIPWRATAFLVVFPAVAIFLVNDVDQGSGDTWPVLPTAWQLIRSGSADLTPVLPLVPESYALDGAHPYCLVQRGDALYSRYPAGMLTFAVPVATMARLLNAPVTYHHVLGRLEKWTAAWVAALALGGFFLTAIQLTAPGDAWRMTAVLATGSVWASTYSQALWQQGGVALWVMVVLFIEFRNQARPFAGATILQGIGCALMLACRPSAILFVIPLGAWVLVRAPARAIQLTAWTIFAYLPWAVFYSALYGTPLGPSTGQLDASFWGAHPLDGLAGVLFSPARGLLVYQPWALLAVLPLISWVKTPDTTPGQVPPGWRWFCLAVISGQVALVSLWACWWGGSCWGSRLLAEVVPLLALLALQPMAQLWRSSPGRGLVLSLGILSFLMHAPGIYLHAGNWNNIDDLDKRPERLWSWSHPPFLYPWQHGNAKH
jgi:hypothetical protein